MKLLSRVDSLRPYGVADQASQSMGFSRQEYWSGLPLPSPGDLPDPGIEPGSPALEADALTAEPPIEGSNLSLLKRLPRGPGKISSHIAKEADKCHF